MTQHGHPKNTTRFLDFQRFDGSPPHPARAELALETALEIVVNGRSYGLLMQTPGAERELVAGYLCTEALIETMRDAAAVDFEAGPEVLGMPGIRARVLLPGLDTSVGLPERPSISLVSSGLGSADKLRDLCGRLSRVRGVATFAWDTILALIPDLRRHQPLYERTKGVHAVALYGARGEFMCCYEDVGRHNALDKVIGRCLLEEWPFDDKLVVLSGRASLEMVMKTARAGFPLLVCFSSPTVLAVQAADWLNLTLVARRKDESLAGFTHVHRLTGAQA